MKIPAFPHILFDEFPTDASTKVCILTRPHYPIPDLSQYHGKLSLYCTASTARIMARFSKKVPLSVLRLLPDDSPDDHQIKWEIINNSSIEGFDTSLAVTCISTGSANGSVMLLIFNQDAPDNLTLYTGIFKRCHKLLLSNRIFKYKSKISDVYYHDSMAHSFHRDIDQDLHACNQINDIIHKYSDYEIHLQMEMFDTLDLAVHLAAHHRLNVKLSEIQQIFIFKTPFNSLFEYTTPLIADREVLNRIFRLRDRPVVQIKSVKTLDLATYKRLFDEEKIINIKLIAGKVEPLSKQEHDGLIYISYSSHAGAFTLSSILKTIEPEHVHSFA